MASLTAEEKRQLADTLNAAQGRRPARAWWEVPRRFAQAHHVCCLCLQVIKPGTEYYDRGSNPRKRGCLPCVAALLAKDGAS
jgi:hypothetical protein